MAHSQRSSSDVPGDWSRERAAESSDESGRSYSPSRSTSRSELEESGDAQNARSPDQRKLISPRRQRPQSLSLSPPVLPLLKPHTSSVAPPLAPSTPTSSSSSALESATSRAPLAGLASATVLTPSSTEGELPLASADHSAKPRKALPLYVQYKKLVADARREAYEGGAGSRSKRLRPRSYHAPYCFQECPTDYKSKPNRRKKMVSGSKRPLTGKQHSKGRQAEWASRTPPAAIATAAATPSRTSEVTRSPSKSARSPSAGTEVHAVRVRHEKQPSTTATPATSTRIQPHGGSGEKSAPTHHSTAPRKEPQNEKSRRKEHETGDMQLLRALQLSPSKVMLTRLPSTHMQPAVMPVSQPDQLAQEGKTSPYRYRHHHHRHHQQQHQQQHQRQSASSQRQYSASRPHRMHPLWKNRAWDQSDAVSYSTGCLDASSTNRHDRRTHHQRPTASQHHQQCHLKKGGENGLTGAVSENDDDSSSSPAPQLQSKETRKQQGATGQQSYQLDFQRKQSYLDTVGTAAATEETGSASSSPELCHQASRAPTHLASKLHSRGLSTCKTNGISHAATAVASADQSVKIPPQQNSRLLQPHQTSLPKPSLLQLNSNSDLDPVVSYAPDSDTVDDYLQSSSYQRHLLTSDEQRRESSRSILYQSTPHTSNSSYQQWCEDQGCNSFSHFNCDTPTIQGRISPCSASDSKPTTPYPSGSGIPRTMWKKRILHRWWMRKKCGLHRWWADVQKAQTESRFPVEAITQNVSNKTLLESSQDWMRFCQSSKGDVMANEQDNEFKLRRCRDVQLLESETDSCPHPPETHRPSTFSRSPQTTPEIDDNQCHDRIPVVTVKSVKEKYQPTCSDISSEDESAKVSKGVCRKSLTKWCFVPQDEFLVTLLQFSKKLHSLSEQLVTERNYEDTSSRPSCSGDNLTMQFGISNNASVTQSETKKTAKLEETECADSSSSGASSPLVTNLETRCEAYHKLRSKTPHLCKTPQRTAVLLNSEIKTEPNLPEDLRQIEGSENVDFFVGTCSIPMKTLKLPSMKDLVESTKRRQVAATDWDISNSSPEAVREDEKGFKYLDECERHCEIQLENGETSESGHCAYPMENYSKTVANSFHVVSAESTSLCSKLPKRSCSAEQMRSLHHSAVSDSGGFPITENANKSATVPQMHNRDNKLAKVDVKSEEESLFASNLQHSVGPGCKNTLLATVEDEEINSTPGELGEEQLEVQSQQESLGKEEEQQYISVSNSRWSYEDDSGVHCQWLSSDNIKGTTSPSVSVRTDHSYSRGYTSTPKATKKTENHNRILDISLTDKKVETRAMRTICKSSNGGQPSLNVTMQKKNGLCTVPQPDSCSQPIESYTQDNTVSAQSSRSLTKMDSKQPCSEAEKERQKFSKNVSLRRSGYLSSSSTETNDDDVNEAYYEDSKDSLKMSPYPEPQEILPPCEENSDHDGDENLPQIKHVQKYSPHSSTEETATACSSGSDIDDSDENKASDGSTTLSDVTCEQSSSALKVVQMLADIKKEQPSDSEQQSGIEQLLWLGTGHPFHNGPPCHSISKSSSHYHHPGAKASAFREEALSTSVKVVSISGSQQSPINKSQRKEVEPPASDDPFGKRSNDGRIERRGSDSDRDSSRGSSRRSSSCDSCSSSSSSSSTSSSGSSNSNSSSTCSSSTNSSSSSTTTNSSSSSSSSSNSSTSTMTSNNSGSSTSCKNNVSISSADSNSSSRTNGSSSVNTESTRSYSEYRTTTPQRQLPKTEKPKNANVNRTRSIISSSCGSSDSDSDKNETRRKNKLSEISTDRRKFKRNDRSQISAREKSNSVGSRRVNGKQSASSVGN